jgi:glycosyltransferase involved in cell wall biosynthesis
VRKSSQLHPSAETGNGEKTIFILVPYYLPGFKAGGPIQSIAGLVEGLNDEYNFKIVCGDRDLGDKQSFSNEPIGHWYEFGAANVLRIPPGPAGAWMLIRALRMESYDVLYMNGILPRIYSMLPLLCRRIGILPRRPIVLAPRGEFSRGSLSLKSKRKYIYIKLSTWIGFFRGIIWHASSKFEEADIRRSMGDLTVIESANLMPCGSEAYRNSRAGIIVIAKNMQLTLERVGGEKLRKRVGQLRCVFISRISPEKNLLFALRMMQGLTGEVTFDIYGPVGNAEYWNKCKAAIAALPANVRVQYMGIIEHERVGEVFAQHDLFLLPSLGENYSHVTCEALSAGCPVLISDRTPWRNLQEKGVGWDVPLEDEGRFHAILQRCVDADGEWYAGLEVRAAEYGNVAASDPSIIDENRRMFRYAAFHSLNAR